MSRLPEATSPVGASDDLRAGLVNSVTIEREVAKRFGSLEGLAYHLLVEEPGLLEASPADASRALGLPESLVRFLWFASRDFRVLLDEGLAREVWSFDERRQAYGSIRDRVLSGRDRLAETVRAAEYLDSKIGVRKSAPSEEGRSVNVSVSVVREGEGDWSDSHQALTFGAEPAKVVGVRAEREARPVTPRGSVEAGRPAGLAESESS